jgi:carbonic anhydrase
MNSLPSVHLDSKFKDHLLELNTREEIPQQWRNTPIESFILSQNCGWPIQTSGKPELLIGTCIEFRYALPIPRMFAYVIRRASGRLIGSEFSVAYTIARGVEHIAIVGHNDCGMSQLNQMAPHVVDALADQGWSRHTAQHYVDTQAKRLAISNELDTLKEEYKRLRKIFPKMKIAPLFVCLYDGKLRLPKWYQEVESKTQSEQAPLPVVPDELINQLP